MYKQCVRSLATLAQPASHAPTAQAQAAIAALPPGVPPLATRWDNSMTFGQFTNRTIEKYSTAT